MKVSVALIAVGLAAERKVPPRHPDQRLNRLRQFAEEWLNDNLPELASRDSWIAKFNTNADRMARAFQRDNCGFYDADTKPHGGPGPDEHINNKNGRVRDRREVSEDGTIEDGSLERYDKTNPIRGIKQITTGYRKWAERFINECHGQRKHKYQVNRMNRWFKKLGDHWTATQ
jgi:hypothetical protein